MKILDKIKTLFTQDKPLSHDEYIFKIACDNFTYVPDNNGAKNLQEDLKFTEVVDSVSVPFSGDCDNFAFNLKHQIGGKVWICYVDNNVAHAVLVKDGIVYDFYKGMYKAEDYPARLLFWVELDGTYGSGI